MDGEGARAACPGTRGTFLPRPERQSRAPRGPGASPGGRAEPPAPSPRPRAPPCSPRPAPSPRPGRTAGAQRAAQPAACGARRARLTGTGTGRAVGIIPWLARAAAPGGRGRPCGRRAAAGGAGAERSAAAQEGAGDHVPGEEAAAARALGPQEIPALRQEIGILTKHSRPAPGAPASLNPWPAGPGWGRGRGRGWGVLPPRLLRAPPAARSEVQGPGAAQSEPWPWQAPTCAPTQEGARGDPACHLPAASCPGLQHFTWLPPPPFQSSPSANFICVQGQGAGMFSIRRVGTVNWMSDPDAAFEKLLSADPLLVKYETHKSHGIWGFCS
ncbi:translation initiation factor IF-2-like [Vulpes lagopus]|uniref:translation initiation factor IF-2-like n=1 Tax=Vulpes lagopus TaxID=494514 RepID=UPI001BC92735|nr:translation initiation factor IF-2-like [Vulpes lagopus]